MSKWSIFLNKTRYCVSQRGTGNRPCDMGVPCDRCYYDKALNDQFKKEEDSIDESLYCKYCGHELRPHEKGTYNGICETCHEEDW